MTSKVMCPMCQARESADALLCQGAGSCTERLQVALAGVRQIHDAALVTYTRSARIGAGGGRRGDEQPLPFDPRITPLVREVAAAVDAIARIAGVDAPLMTRRATLAAARVGSVLRARVDPPALAWYRSLLFSLARLELAVDVAEQGQYVGQCNQIRPATDVPGSKAVPGSVAPPAAAPPAAAVCGADLYAKSGEPFVTCPRCGQTWPVAERREILLAAVDDQVVTATVVAKSLTSLGDEVTAERIRQWAHRNQLIPVTRDSQGRPLYRVSDVRRLLAQDAARHAERRLRAGLR